MLWWDDPLSKRLSGKFCQPSRCVGRECFDTIIGMVLFGGCRIFRGFIEVFVLLQIVTCRSSDNRKAGWSRLQSSLFTSDRIMVVKPTVLL